MAMLAGPRRKQKVINLRAKNSAWSNDSNKFGQKMLEKMGWSSGKGLGAKENGIVEHVVAKYKNDDKGFGYVDKNDQWTKHEDDFNALLTNLSSGGNIDGTLHSGISLEDKSKKSKTRVHYHKFTRGKDLTKYSEKDLANIFGKKSFKNEIIIEEICKDDIKSTQHVFTEKGSMEDYFKNKLAAFKSQNKLSFSYDKNHHNADYGFHGFCGTNDENIVKQCTNEIENIKKSKKKKMLLKCEVKESLLYEDCNKDNLINNENNNDIQEQNIKTKKKKRNVDVEEELIITKTSKKKKSKKTDDGLIIEESKKFKKKMQDTKQIQPLVEESHVPKKKKKRKIVDKDV